VSAVLNRPAVLVRRLGLVDYQAAFERMVRFTEERGPASADEIWLLQHPPVFTLGLNADPAHVLTAGDVPVIKTDRGGQVTYHGPGQLVAYVLLDLQRRGLGVRALVSALENAVVAALAGYGIAAAGAARAPGVYVGGAKIASLGLRVRRGCSYHGLALNVSVDLAPFGRINPCGFRGLEVTRVCDLGGPADVETVGQDLEAALLRALGD
jgi:lipoyl(octanoyl) transferase